MKRKKVNKYGGMNDLPMCDKRIRQLWYSMLARCYEERQLKRARGKAYANCTVCEEWHYLSVFARDICELENYDKWRKGEKYVLDKDTVIEGNKEYRKGACTFLKADESSSEMMNRHPEIHEMGAEARKTPYKLTKDGETLSFDSEVEACNYLGVHRGTVCTSAYYGCRCKGYYAARA